MLLNQNRISNIVFPIIERRVLELLLNNFFNRKFMDLIYTISAK